MRILKAGMLGLMFSSVPMMVSAADITDPAEILAAQEVMYAHNYGHSRSFPSESITQETRNTIKRVQKAFDVPVTGELSEELYVLLMIVGVPTDREWGAVSLALNGSSGSSWGQDTREKAVREAYKKCREKADRCAIVSGFKGGKGSKNWLAGVLCTKVGAPAFASVSSRASLFEAAEGIYKNAIGKGYERNRCSMPVAVASDGAHHKPEIDITVSDAILKAQRVMYELRYSFDTDFPDGKLDDETRTTIKLYQKTQKLPVTGILSYSLYDHLMRVGIPAGQLWGAVSVAGNGSYGAVWKFPTREGAVKAADRDCKKEASRCLSESRSYTNDEDRGWVVAVRCKDDDGNGAVGVSSDVDLRKSTHGAYAQAMSYGYNKKQCAVLVTVAADGTRTKQ